MMRRMKKLSTITATWIIGIVIPTVVEEKKISKGIETMSNRQGGHAARRGRPQRRISFTHL
jgi:hypothetical protein